MTSTIRTAAVKDRQGRLLTVTCPTREDIYNLKVGDIAPNCFGEAEVTEIYALRDDYKGRAFVCYYTKLSDTSRISHSLREGEMVRSMNLCSGYTSAELEDLERQAGRI